MILLASCICTTWIVDRRQLLFFRVTSSSLFGVFAQFGKGFKTQVVFIVLFKNNGDVVDRYYITFI